MSDTWNHVRPTISTLLATYGLQVVAALAIALVGWLVAGWAGRTVRRYGEKSERVSKTLLPLLIKLARASVLTITLVAVLDKFGVAPASILAFLGAFGLALGLALKDTISDVAAGVVILVLRPFDVGDDVDINGTRGIVDAIDTFEVHLTTMDGVPLVLPNALVRGAKIQNFSRADKRRVEIDLGVGYRTDIAQVVEALTALVGAERRVLAEPAPLVDAQSLGDHRVKLQVKLWVKASELDATKSDLLFAIKEKLEALGVEMAEPPMVGAKRL
jgi:small conductance mechanosensitive channel